MNTKRRIPCTINGCDIPIDYHVDGGLSWDDLTDLYMAWLNDSVVKVCGYQFDVPMPPGMLDISTPEGRDRYNIQCLRALHAHMWYIVAVVIDRYAEDIDHIPIKALSALVDELSFIDAALTLVHM